MRIINASTSADMTRTDDTPNPPSSETDRPVDEGGPLTIPACPSWCVEGDGHGYEPDTAVDGHMTYMRCHNGPGDHAVLLQVEQNCAGVVTLLDATVYVDIPARELDLGRAQAFTEQLVAATELLSAAPA